MGNKKILISLPESLLCEADEAAAAKSMCRSEWIRGAIKKDVLRERQLNLEKALKQGYEDMAKINISLAEEGIFADNEQLLTYEQNLSESE